jgi:hypothetical protein
MSGRAGYVAYAETTGGKTFDGREMPSWDELPGRIQEAWNAAAKAMAKEVYDSLKAADDSCPATQPAPKGYPFA